MPVTTLPNGLAFEAPTEREARFLYREVIEPEAYVRNGIELADGATVLDVGANVGAFSVALAQRHRDLRLVLFEPVPDTFEILRRNAGRLLSDADVTLVPKGVWSAPGHVTFRLPPNSSAMASAAPPENAGHADLEQWVQAGLDDARRGGLIRPRVADAVERGLGHAVLRPVTLGAIAVGYGAVAQVQRLRTKEVECELTTISATLRDLDIETVDLAKIDVEGAEWEALQGIAEDDWPRIRQLAVEVHDVDDRVARMRELLEAKGYRVVVEAADWAVHRLLGIHMLYAARS